MSERRSGSKHRGRSGAPAGKVLRIGIIRGPRIVEERLIRRGETVTVGESVRNTFVLPGSDLPQQHRLFVARGGRYHLLARSAFGGKLFVDDSVQPLAQVALDRGARRGADTWIPLDPGVRGKVQLAGTTILFQFVQAPPEPRRVEASFSPLAFGQMDWVFTAFVAFSLVLNLVGYSYINSRPPPQSVSIDQINKRFAQVWFTEDPLEDDQELPPPIDDEGLAEVDSTDTRPVPDETDPATDPKDDGSAEADAGGDEELTRDQRRERAREAMEGVGLAPALMGTDGNTRSDLAIRDLVGEPGALQRDLDLALDAAGRVAIAGIGGEPILRNLPTGPDGLEGLTGGPRTSGPVTTGPGTRTQTEVVTRLELETPQLDPGTDPSGITDVVGKNKGQIKACYDRIIKTTPDIEGRIEVTIVVAEDGSVLEVWLIDNSTDSAELASCIQRRIKRWNFPATGEEYEVSYPFAMFAS
jgi:hypothetical protein